MKFSLAYFIACLQVLSGIVRNGEDTPQGFVKKMRKRGQVYWEKVQVLMKQLLEEIAPRLKDVALSQGKEELIWTSWEKEAIMIFHENFPHDIFTQRSKLQVLFVFDEARHLVRNLDGQNSFPSIRRSTCAMPQCGVLSLFMDTSSEITNFAAPDWADPSDRISAGKFRLAPPIWACFSADVLEKDLQPLFSTSRMFSNIVRPDWVVRYGRPLWWATFRSYLHTGKEQDEIVRELAFKEVYQLACDKLLGGTGKWTQYITGRNAVIPEDAALAVLGASIGLDVDPRSKLASKLVANNLLTVVSVSPSRELVWTAWSIEPVVAKAAAEAMSYLHREGRSRELYGALVNGLSAGWIDRGYTGELVARIILLNAMSEAGKGAGWCTVDDFCKHLARESLSELIWKRKQELTEKETLLTKARLHFNSFHRIYKKTSDLTFDDALKCFEHHCAVICRGGAWGVDFLIFAFTGGENEELTMDNLTVIYCQVKLRKQDGTDICLAKISPQYAGFAVALKLPYLSLYMNVMDKGKKSRAYLVDSKKIESSVKKYASRPIQAALEEIENESSEQPVDDPMEILVDEGEEVEKKRPAVQAWKAWLKADRELQTAMVVKGLNAFDLKASLQDELKQVVMASRTPFFHDGKNDLHTKLLTLQESKLQEMFKIENLQNYTF